MVDSLKSVNLRPGATATPQTEKAAEEQVKNSAGGYTFTISDLDRAKRFLILGSESNFYTPGAELSADNAKTLIGLASDVRTSKPLVDAIVEISTQGRAPKANPALFALAIAASYGDDESRAYALSKLPEVARIATHLFIFAGYVEQFRGWGRALRRAVANWYTSKDVDKLAYQTVKYQSREGYTHRDLFRLSHPARDSFDTNGVWKEPTRDALGKWILTGVVSDAAPKIVQGFTQAHQPKADIAGLIREYGLSWEMVPTELLNEPTVWKALLNGNVPLGALIRQLPRLTRLGVLGPLNAETNAIVARLTDKAEIERARIHPINVLIALKTYASGRSERGTGTWTPVPAITDALDKAFYLAFKNVEPAGKRTLLAFDVSASMGWGGSLPAGLSPREATAAMGLVTAATEPFTHAIGFTGGSRYGWGTSRDRRHSYAQDVTDLSNIFSARRRLDDVVRDISGLPFGGTDCALPMLYALEQGLEVDTFCVFTDNETWAGLVHPFEALERYRTNTGIPAKLVVLSTESTPFSIAREDDAGMLDIAGFDSAAPALIADFSRGL